MLARALSDPAEINSQGDQSGIIQRRGRAKNDFVVHRAAKERMRMQHERDALNRLGARLC